MECPPDTHRPGEVLETPLERFRQLQRPLGPRMRTSRMLGVRSRPRKVYPPPMCATSRMTRSALFLLALTANGCASTPPSSKLPNHAHRSIDPALVLSSRGGAIYPAPNTTADLGRGFDSLHGEVLGNCVQKADVTSFSGGSGTGGGATSELRVTYARNRGELTEALGVRAEAAATFQFFGGSARAAFAQRNNFSSTSGFLIISQEIINSTEILESYELTRQASEILQSRGPAAFYEMCGDQFVAARITGGSLHVVLTMMDATGDITKASSSAAGLKSWLFSADGSMTSAARRTFETTNVTIQVFQSGGHSVPEKLADLISYAFRFRSEVTGINAGKAAPVAFITKPYSVVPSGSSASFISLGQQRRRLDELARSHGSARTVLSDLRLALNSQGTCKNRGERLAKAIDEVESLMKNMELDAGICAEEPLQGCDERKSHQLERAKYENLLRECMQSPLVRSDESQRQDLALREARKGEPDGFPCKVWEVSSVQPLIADDSIDQITITATALAGGSLKAAEKRFVKKNQGWAIVPPLFIPSQTRIDGVVLDDYRVSCNWGLSSCGRSRIVAEAGVTIPAVVAGGKLSTGAYVVQIRCTESEHADPRLLPESRINALEDLSRRMGVPIAR